MEEYQSKEYNLNKDWKFLYILYFANNFRNVLSIDHVSTIDLENSLNYPEIEPVCLNILLKVLMKKALFKPNSKVFENFEYSKLQEMLLKKINYFYKTYIRHLKKIYMENDNKKIYDLINNDINEFNLRKDRFELKSSNLSEKEYIDGDLKLLMIVEFFRNLKGKNPFLKIEVAPEEMDLFLGSDDKLSSYMNDYISYIELPVDIKVEILFFFCNYAVTFSGRAPFFKQELNQVEKRMKSIGKDNEGNLYYYISINKDCRLYKENYAYELSLVIKNYEELELFLNKLDGSRNINDIALLKNLREILLTLKENDEEEKKKEINFQRKQQAFEKAKKLANKPSDNEKYQNSDYFLMNISDHVITRNQLNQITKVNISTSNNKKQMTEDEKKKEKIEKEKLEREKRLEKRTKTLEKRIDEEVIKRSVEISKPKFLNNKRRIRNKIKSSNFSSSEEEYLSEVDSDSEVEIELCSDKEDHDNIEEDFNMQINDNPNDIILDGYLIYRYINNQIELDGNWYMSNETSVKEKLSYLFVKSNDYMECIVNKDEIDNNHNNENFKIKLCAANIFEAMLLNKPNVFESVLHFLNGEYSGYFMYYGKTLEDRLDLNLELQDSLVKVNGEGTNNLGNFSVVGYMNFFRNKDNLVEKNSLDSEFIKLAEFKLNKIYTAFNPTENYRVIKSYQHRRKRIEDDI